MAKVSVELIHDVLTQNELDAETVQKLIEQIEQQAAAEAEAEKATREPPVKKQFVMILSDPSGTIPEKQDYVGWVAQIPEDDPIGDTTDRLIRASYEYNISKKGRKYPVKTVGEACEAVGARFLKEQGLAIKTKTPVSILITDNKIPEIEDDFPAGG